MNENCNEISIKSHCNDSIKLQLSIRWHVIWNNVTKSQHNIDRHAFCCVPIWTEFEFEFKLHYNRNHARCEHDDATGLTQMLFRKLFIHGILKIVSVFSLHMYCSEYWVVFFFLFVAIKEAIGVLLIFNGLGWCASACTQRNFDITLMIFIEWSTNILCAIFSVH